MIRFLMLVSILLTLGGAVSHAQETPSYPTVDLLHQVELPSRDLVSLAQRLKGLTDIPTPPINPAPFEVGTVRTFWVSNSDTNQTFQIKATLQTVGTHIYLWVENGIEVDPARLQKLVDQFDEKVYQPVRDLWGEEPSPGIDGDLHVHGLFANNLGEGLAAYFAARHAAPIEADPQSNEMEMFFYNYPAVASIIGDFTLASITGHEFQHMIRSAVDDNEEGWLDEGFSEFTQFYLEAGDTYPSIEFLRNPSTQLNTWNSLGENTAHYGASTLWLIYLYDRFGLTFLQQISNEPLDGLAGIDAVLQRENLGTTVDELFADWVVANLLWHPDETPEGIYGYDSLPALGELAITELEELPLIRDLTLSPYATDYFRWDAPLPETDLTVKLTFDPTTTLIDAPDTGGIAYSLRGDTIDTTLTIPLDLTSTTTPEVRFDVWHDIEAFWDYGYVMVSTDEGQTWDILPTETTTTDDPNYTAYGAGYTAQSEGWLADRVDLSAYIGQRVQLRFELINDDAINQAGLAVDNVRLLDGERVLMEETFDNLELPTGWQADGWIITDNRLPQVVWLQVIQQTTSGASVTRWNITASEAVTFRLLPDVEAVTFSVSPYAPLTTVPLALQVIVDAHAYNM